MQKEKIINANFFIPLSLFLVAFIIRLPFLSKWLEDWDSVQFTIALNHYSITEHLPHPPGYPLYILLGKVFNIFFSDGAYALTIMSAVFGSLSIIPIYILAKKMFNFKIAIFSSVILMITPIHWLLSTVALTNITGQFFLSLAAYFLYIYRNSSKIIISISLFFGLILGVRFTEIPIIISLLLLVLYYKKNVRFAFLAFLAFLSGILLWLLPLIVITGFDEFIDSYTNIANYIFTHDASLGAKLSYINLKTRLSNYINLLSISYTPLLLTFFALMGFLIFLKEKIKLLSFEIIFLFTWLISYVTTHLIFYNMEVTRYNLPISAPLAILVSIFIVKIFSGKLQIIVFSLIVLFMLNSSLDQLNRFKGTIPATISPILYVQENFNPDQVLIISSLLYRQFQFYLPKYQHSFIDDFDPGVLNSKDIIIIDYLGALEKYPALKQYIVSEHKQFIVDKDIFPRVYKTDIYILKKID